MTGRNVAEPPSGRGLAVLVLGALGLAPPTLIVGPSLMEAHAASVGISRPDAASADLAAGPRPASHTDRWGDRPGS
ncbi:hypothetical protein AB0D04_08650 [Streptomyces sp. NPDC048483]|uniref:hypothetical protein n=1 Tax=Streptomyces sp. NPDC048483 TaxID=3154927 RepID=UPI003436A190